MKRYLLLASVAGCLLNAGNALADDPSHQITVSANLASALSWYVQDVDFGNIVLSGTAASGDEIARFTNGNISYTSGKSVAHGSAQTGAIALSSGASLVTGVTFDVEEVELKKEGSNAVVAKMVGLSVSDRVDEIGEKFPDRQELGGYFVNGALQLNTEAGAFDAAGETITGVMTVTLQF